MERIDTETLYRQAGGVDAPHTYHWYKRYAQAHNEIVYYTEKYRPITVRGLVKTTLPLTRSAGERQAFKDWLAEEQV